MLGDFTKALEYVLLDEGGYVNNPADPGGATMGGITQNTYDLFRTSSGKTTRPVKDILPREQEIIYRVNYWTRIRGDELPKAWAYAVFDYSVHSGCSKAVKVLQEVLGFTGKDVDGVLGKQTLGRVMVATPDQLSAYLDARLAHLKRLPTWSTFGHGWANRLAKVRARVL